MAEIVNGNLRAFLWVIRHCEGTSGPDGYKTLFGGTTFNSFSDHPRIYKTFSLNGKQYKTSAAGAYQILASTWDEVRKIGNLPDFGPGSQDRAAILLIQRRGALEDVKQGKFEEALKKTNQEWASLPGAPYGQPTRTLAYCKRVYEQNGGTYMSEVTEDQMVAPIVVAAGSAVAKPFIEAAFKELLNYLPTLAKMFGSDSRVSQRNQQALEMAVNVVKEAIGAKNEQEAVELVKQNPTVAKQADEAVKANAYELFGVDLSRVKEARDFDRTFTYKSPFWVSPAFWITVMLLPLLYGTVYHILTGSPADGFSGEFKAATGSAIVTGLLGAVVGFWLGSSFTTSRSRGLGAVPEN